MIGLIGKNIGMTSIFLENGKNTACTIIQINHCYITQLKTMKKDGYCSVQIATDNINKKKVNKPLLGHFKNSGIFPKKKIIEIKGIYNFNYKIGQKFNIDIFKEGELVIIKSISKGKGFQGVIKRHNFSGVGEKSHGQHNRLRAPGSIGAGSNPSRVFKGKKMAGRMGGINVTIKNLKILKIDRENNLLILKGSIPGNKNSYLTIRKKNGN